MHRLNGQGGDRPAPRDSRDAEIVRLRRAVRALVPLALGTVIRHEVRGERMTAVLDGETHYWSETDGCVPDCPGCRREDERDRALDLAEEALGEGEDTCVE